MSAVKQRAEKAYLNESFLTSPEARIIRMLSEYVEPRMRLSHARVRDTIVFFGSARIQSPEEVDAEIHQLENARSLAQQTNSMSPDVETELDEAMRRAKMHSDFSRYYVEASELARLLTEWSITKAAQNYERAQVAKGQIAAAQVKEQIPYVNVETIKTHSFKQRYVICSGGGPGIMEAANRGATLGGGKSIGFNIALPFEQMPNSYITDELNFEFHYFFMRKFWFAYLGKALVIFPGGFGTMDELFELLTLIQTGKIRKKMPIVVYGQDYWQQIVNFDKLAEFGMISRSDLNLVHFSDTPEDAFEHIKSELTRLDEGEETFLHSNPLT
ncbi:MAG: LOG family protein [Bacteroidota bacterium]|nr:LOG family protein [Bacteroidota bacterium]MDP4233395.1 LOG family protein [Bacteroidota bacterium]MDP4242261.1 LOG family protein [Bacteroidota bacterium]MDP4287017.1 LOG family protein [Bacteroidota bacterium]